MSVATAQVQFKKKTGAMSVSAKSLSFEASNTADMAVNTSVAMSAVKSQAMNTDTSKKVLLKVTLVSGDPLVFIFVGNNAISDRQAVSDVIARVLAELRASAQVSATTISSRDIQLRSALLSNPKYKDLARLHRDLVIGGVISEHDFWNTHKDLLVNQEFAADMKKGISSASLIDVAKAAAGANSGSSDQVQTSTTVIKFTPEVIHSIFVQFPAVQMAFEKYVPEKMSEHEFWTKYAQSKAFHALKSGGKTMIGGPGASDEIFTASEWEVDDDSLPIPKKPRGDPTNKLLDLSSTIEDHLDYGNAPDTTMKAGSYRTALPIIRRLNRHSTVVLKSFGQQKSQSSSAIYQEETELEDLVPTKEFRPRELTIHQNANYYSGGSALPANTDSVRLPGGKVPSLDGWQPNLIGVVVDPAKAGKVFQALNKASMKRKTNIPTCKDTGGYKIPESVEQIYSQANELLRHYWAFKRKAGVQTGDMLAVTMTKLDKLKTAIGTVHKHIREFERSLSGNDAHLLDGVTRALAFAVE